MSNWYQGLAFGCMLLGVLWATAYFSETLARSSSTNERFKQLCWWLLAVTPGIAVLAWLVAL